MNYSIYIAYRSCSLNNARRIQKGQGIYIATNSFSYVDCLFLANYLSVQYGLRTSVIKTGVTDQWRISIWKESMPLLVSIVGPHMHVSMYRKVEGYL